MTARSKMVEMNERLTTLEGGGTPGGTDLEPRVAALEASVVDLQARVAVLEGTPAGDAPATASRGKK